MRVFYDVDTQHDFMDADGALYVPDAELIKPALAQLTQYAKAQFIPVLGSVDKHFGTEEYKAREGELIKWGGPFPDHCMGGTKGQLKIDETTLRLREGGESYYLNDHGVYIPHILQHWATQEAMVRDMQRIPGWSGDPFFIHETWIEQVAHISEHDMKRAMKEINRVRNKEKTPDGIYFEKQSYDVFTNPQITELVKRAQVKEAVVYGVATDFCVKAAVLGLQARGVQCYVVEEAFKGVFPDKSATALEEMTRAGARFVKVKDILEGRV